MRIRILSLLLILSLVLVACGQDKELSTDDVNIAIAVSPAPAMIGDAIVAVTLTDNEGNPINGALVRVQGNMEHDSMMPVEGEISEGTDGVYEVPFQWTMAGDWVLTIEVTLANGEIASQEFDFTGVQGSMDDSEMDHNDDDAEAEATMEMDHNDDDHEHNDDDHEHGTDEVIRIPNNGSTISIVSPEDGATLSASDVVIEVELENFAIDEEGNHWHIYVDGTSWGMIMGGELSRTLDGLEAGEHTIVVYLTVGTHEELEDGASITITVEE